MSYISIATWRDLTDGHLYREGDPFPFDGREVDPDRLAQLETGRNQAGLRLIQPEAAKYDRLQAPEADAPQIADLEPQTASEKPRAKTARPRKPKVK